MHARRQTVLVTGFGPFPGVPENASAHLVSRLVESRDARLAGFRLVGTILPTEWRRGPSRLLALLDEHRPVLALHFGVSSRAAGFEVETRGRNRCMLSQDACGEMPARIRLDDEGPEHLPATIPTHFVVRRLRACGLTAQISRDAGGYLCNALLYTSLDYARRRHTRMRAGFVHIPDALSEQRGAGTRRMRLSPRIDFEQAIDGATEMLAVSLRQP